MPQYIVEQFLREDAPICQIVGFHDELLYRISMHWNWYHQHIHTQIDSSLSSEDATMLKSTAYSIAPTLTKLFNKSISYHLLGKHLPLFQYQKVI